MKQNQERFKREHRYIDEQLKATKEETKKAPTVVKYDDGRQQQQASTPISQPTTLPQPTSSPSKENHEDEDQALIAKLMQEEADAEEAKKFAQQSESPNAFRYNQPIVSDYDSYVE